VTKNSRRFLSCSDSSLCTISQNQRTNLDDAV
jgi:hypothetical protein